MACIQNRAYAVTGVLSMTFRNIFNLMIYIIYDVKLNFKKIFYGLDTKQELTGVLSMMFRDIFNLMIYFMSN